MRTDESHCLQLSPDAIANADFPYDARLAHARRFLSSRGITAVRPLYGARAQSLTLNERLGRAANDDANVEARRRDPSAA